MTHIQTLGGLSQAALDSTYARLVDVQSTRTTDGAIVAGRHNPVDATSGNRTVTLADAASAGLLAAVSKKDSSANTVTVSVAHLRDGGPGSITLVGQYEALLLTSKADGTWWPVGDHKTKAYLDAAYKTPTDNLRNLSDSTFLTALNNAFVSKGKGDPAGTIAPLFPQTLTTGLTPDTPTNLRTGLSTSTFADGGFVQELTIAVTGTAGSNVLTSTDTAKVAGLGAVAFAAVLNASDGSTDFFVTVISNNGSNQITLRQTLAANFTGTLSAKYDAALGQHLTQGATKAYAEHLASFAGVTASRGALLGGTFAARPTSYDDVWAANTALTAYGVSNSASPVVQSGKAIATTRNVLDYGRMPVVPLALASAVQIGTHTTGHGATGTMYPGRKDVVVEFFTGATRSSTTDNSAFRLTVTVVADGVTVYSATHDAWLTRVCVPVFGADKVTIDVANADGAIYNIFIAQTMMREAGTGGKVSSLRKIVTCGDSWFARYAGVFATALAAKTGATVVNHSLGGMTTDWALSWFDTYIAAEKPDEAWFHFWTNDSNNLTGTFTAPDGSTPLLWPAGQTDAQSQVRWRQNILKLISKCQALGIKPVIVKPGGTASEGQMQKHAEWAAYLERPAPLNWSASATELADAAAYVNTVGKVTGVRAHVGASVKTASGPNTTDAWSNLAEDALVPLQKATLHRNNYILASGVAIGTDTNSDGLSDGLLTQDFSTVTGDTYTYSIVGGNQHVANIYGSSAAGTRRVRFNFTAVAGKEYLVVFDIANAPASYDFNNTVSDLTASTVTVTSVNGARLMDGSGAGQVYYRATANASAAKYAAIGAGRTNSTTIQFDIKKAFVLDIAALLADAPNLASLSTAALVAFVVSLQA